MHAFKRGDSNASIPTILLLVPKIFRVPSSLSALPHLQMRSHRTDSNASTLTTTLKISIPSPSGPTTRFPERQRLSSTASLSPFPRKHDERNTSGSRNPKPSPDVSSSRCGGDEFPRPPIVLLPLLPSTPRVDTTTSDRQPEPPLSSA